MAATRIHQFLTRTDSELAAPSAGRSSRSNRPNAETMLKTKFCELFGIEYPIVCAGMGTIALANLAAAVSEAGGLGPLGLPGFPPDAIGVEIAAARRITSKPIVVNQLIPFLQPGIFEALAKQPISAVTLFW